MTFERKLQRAILKKKGLSGHGLRQALRAIRRRARAGEPRIVLAAVPHPEMHAPDPTWRKPKRQRSKEQNAAKRKRQAQGRTR